jgi:hypothetical protein
MQRNRANQPAVTMCQKAQALDQPGFHVQSCIGARQRESDEEAALRIVQMHYQQLKGTGASGCRSP